MKETATAKQSFNRNRFLSHVAVFFQPICGFFMRSDGYDRIRHEFISACDGWVRTKKHARLAVRYYKAFYRKLESGGELTEKSAIAIKKTIKKYKHWKPE